MELILAFILRMYVAPLRHSQYLDHRAANGRMTNSELERILKEAAVTDRGTIRRFPAGTEENHEKPQDSRYLDQASTECKPKTLLLH
jgi:hypothetical protein